MDEDYGGGDFEQVDFGDSYTADSADAASDFESFDYSSGESEMAWSDAQNVDYGFDTSPDMTADSPESGAPSGDSQQIGYHDPVYNDTPEDKTSDNGVSTQPYTPSGMMGGNSSSGGSKPPFASSSGGSSAPRTNPLPQTATKGTAQTPSKPRAPSYYPSVQTSSTGQQRETAVKPQYVGQLGPAPSNLNIPLLIVGAVAVFALARSL